MFGYKQVDGRLEIVPEEAELLRLAADLYLEGYGRYKLEDAFAEAGIRGRHGAALSGHGIIDLLCNEKIVGDMLLQKTFVEDPITKVQRTNNGEKTQYLVENSHTYYFYFTFILWCSILINSWHPSTWITWIIIRWYFIFCCLNYIFCYHLLRCITISGFYWHLPEFFCYHRI